MGNGMGRGQNISLFESLVEERCEKNDQTVIKSTAFSVVVPET
jgi:hypothetical protein